MARKKKEPENNKKKIDTSGVVGLVGSTTEQAISETLEVMRIRNGVILAMQAPDTWLDLNKI